MAAGDLRIALDQGTGHSGDTSSSLARLDRTARRAAGAGARLLVGPEMSLTGYNIGARTARLAEPADGPLFERVARTAADTGTAIVYGYPELSGGRVYNSVQLVDPQGRRTGYRKTHLFGDLDRSRFSPGAVPVVQTDLHGLRVGFLICYDVEFPEAVRAHALAGTELLLVPTALMYPHTVVATALVPARAFENQIYIAYVNRCDAEDGLDYCGRSRLAAPDGTEPLRAGPGAQLLIGDVSRALIQSSRARNTYLADRRPELYASLGADTASSGTGPGPGPELR